MKRMYSPNHHTLSPGTVLHNNYQIENVLGQGGFAITYSGLCLSTGEKVAIKEYYPERMGIQPDSEEYQKAHIRFLKEAELLKKFHSHENIVSVRDFFEENGTAYIVMEYLDGPTLSQFIRENGAINFQDALTLFLPVIAALSEIHAQGLIHRDISPDNLILGTDNALHLIDFGAASYETFHETQNTVILKAGFAPPEQYLSSEKIGAWIDVYALCATFYFALTTQIPSESIHRLDDDSLEELAKIPSMEDWQKRAIEKGLQIRFSKRFRNMEELYDALTIPPVTDSDTTQLGTGLTRETQKKLYRMKQHPGTRGLILVIGLSAAMGFAILYWGKTQEHVPKEMENPQTNTPQSIVITTRPMPTATAEPSHTLTMPKLTGKTKNQAKKILRKLDPHIQIKTKTAYSTTKQKGKITAQSISEGIAFTKGKLPTIVLTIGKGKRPNATAVPTPAPRAAKKPKPTISTNDNRPVISS